MKTQPTYQKIILWTLLLLPISLISQELQNKGVIQVNNNTVVYNEGSVHLVNGSSIINQGEIQLKQDWINYSGTTGLTLASTGSVHMIGGYQEFSGNDVTLFYDLNLIGTAVKSVQQSIEISNTLNLNASILETNDNLVTLNNPDPASLTWDKGFISSELLGGYFIRQTNAASVYDFPVGSINQTGNYRPVQIIPENNNANSYGVRYAHVNPDFDYGTSASGAMAPFLVDAKGAGVQWVNDQYYHNVYRFSGNSTAKVTLYFFDSDVTEDINSAAQWSPNTLKWEDAQFNVAPTSGNLLAYNSPNVQANGVVDNFVHDAFSLSETGMDIVIYNGISPNNDGKNDFFVIPGLENYPNNRLTIYNRWGDIVFDQSPYENNFNGISQYNGLWGEELQEDTYFYTLKLNNEKTITNYLELIRD